MTAATDGAAAVQAACQPVYTMPHGRASAAGAGCYGGPLGGAVAQAAGSRGTSALPLPQTDPCWCSITMRQGMPRWA